MDISPAKSPASLAAPVKVPNTIRLPLEVQAIFQGKGKGAAMRHQTIPASIGEETIYCWIVNVWREKLCFLSRSEQHIYGNVRSGPGECVVVNKAYSRGHSILNPT